MKLIIIPLMIMVSAFSYAGQNEVPLIKPEEVTSLTEQQKSAVDGFLKRKGLKQGNVIAIVKWTESDLEILNNIENIKTLNVQMPKFPVQWPVTQKTYQIVDGTLIWFGKLSTEYFFVTRKDDFIKIAVPWGFIDPIIDTDLVIFYNDFPVD